MTPFTQGDNSLSRRFGGLGIGLTLTKKVVESLGGEVRVRSLPKKGTEFTLAIPIHNVNLPSKASITN